MPQHVAFWVWHLSCSIMVLMFVHVSQLHTLLWRGYVTFSGRSPIAGPLDCLSSSVLLGVSLGVEVLGRVLWGLWRGCRNVPKWLRPLTFPSAGCADGNASCRHRVSGVLETVFVPAPREARSLSLRQAVRSLPSLPCSAPFCPTALRAVQSTAVCVVVVSCLRSWNTSSLAPATTSHVKWTLHPC